MFDVLGNTLTFIFALGLIIFVHEAGHLLVAKYFDVRVLTFSLGFGKRLWGFRRGETEYRVALIPLGGYVQMAGEEGADASEDPRDFVNKPRWQRILVYIGGPFMNVVLSVLLIAAVFVVGIQVAVPPDGPPVIGTLAEGSAGAVAGLQEGDLIAALDGEEIGSWDDVRFTFLTSPEREIPMEVVRDGERLSLSIIPRKIEGYEYGDAGVYPKSLPMILQITKGGAAERGGLLPDDVVRRIGGQPLVNQEDFIARLESNPGNALRFQVERDGELVELSVTPDEVDGVGKIGVAVGAQTYLQRYAPMKALQESIRFNIDTVEKTFVVLGKLFAGQMGPKSAFSGPLDIAVMSGDAARSGGERLFFLIGLISISIGILNLLPIPVLDGGQILILLIESVRRRDLSLRLKERINQVGFIMIVGLMVMVLYFDIVKRIPPGLLPGS